MPAPRIRADHWQRLLHSTGLVLLACFAIGCQQGAGGEAGTPKASFAQDGTAGAPGLTVQFTNTSTGDITSYLWDFGPLGSSTAQHPQMTFPDVGSYSVALTVSGPRGTSTTAKPALIEVALAPVAGLTCLPTLGFAPLTVFCTDESLGASSVSWDFGDGSPAATGLGGGVHVYTDPGSYTVAQVASSAGGEALASSTIEVLPLDILPNPASGPAPLDVTFSAETGGQSGLFIWLVDDQVVPGATTLSHRFRSPGSYSVRMVFSDPTFTLVGEKLIDYVVDYGPAAAAFAPSVPGGSGPLDVTFLDASAGAIDQWEWSFGDGSQCVFPTPSDPDPDHPIETCDASSPSHTYQDVGDYTVTLTVTGPAADPNDPPIVSSTTVVDAVRVYIVDPSFELQTANAEIGGVWTPLRPSDALEAAQHVAFASAQGIDAGMPTEGTRWAVLTGLGTDGTTAVESIENGIRQDFLRPLDEPVLEFDYVLLYSEPPASAVLDAVTATVSDGSTTVEIPSARADVASPYAGPSLRFPTRDGSAVRATPVRTASINLLDAFPGAPDDTLFTLTLRTSNAVNEFRSPVAYVDNIRFVAPGNGLFAQFVLETDPVVVGEPASFTDESCLDPSAGSCSAPTHWRWDFDTQTLATPPPTSGSAAQHPTYSFPEAGDYEVTLRTGLAELEAQASLTVRVIDGPTAAFSFAPEGPHTAPAELSFTQLSTADANDPIVAFRWDFGGFGVSNLANPAPVMLTQAGVWVLRLTITTASGQTDTAEITVSIE